MKNLLISAILTIILAPVIAGLFLLLTVVVFIIGCLAVLSLPHTILKHLTQIEEDRKKLTGDKK